MAERRKGSHDKEGNPKKRAKKEEEKKKKEDENSEDDEGGDSDEPSAEFTDGESGGSSDKEAAERELKEAEDESEDDDEEKEDSEEHEEDEIELDEDQAKGKEDFLQRLDVLSDHSITEGPIEHLTENLRHGCLSARQYQWLYGNNRRIVGKDFSALYGKEKAFAESIASMWDEFYAQTKRACESMKKADSKLEAIFEKIKEGGVAGGQQR